MDEQLRARAAARKPGRRRHPAGASRILTAGVSATAALALVAAFGMTTSDPAPATAPQAVNGGVATTNQSSPRPVPARPVPQAVPHTTTRGS